MKLLFLPNEILNIIFNNLSLIDKKGLLLLNKGNIFKQKVINEYRNVIKIQRFYKNNLPRLPQVQHYNSTYDSLYNKKIMVRQYISSYPMEYLLKFPETYIRTLSRNNFANWGISLENNSDSILSTLGNWINLNLSPDINNRTRRDIKKFLDNPLVTKDGLRYVGW